MFQLCANYFIQQQGRSVIAMLLNKVEQEESIVVHILDCLNEYGSGSIIAVGSHVNYVTVLIQEVLEYAATKTFQKIWIPRDIFLNQFNKDFILVSFGGFIKRSPFYADKERLIRWTLHSFRASKQEYYDSNMWSSLYRSNDDVNEVISKKQFFQELQLKLWKLEGLIKKRYHIRYMTYPMKNVVIIDEEVIEFPVEIIGYNRDIYIRMHPHPALLLD